MTTSLDPETIQPVDVDFDDEPAFLGEDATARTRPTEIVDAGPYFMDADWDDDVPLVEPQLMPVEGGLPLLYQGESHMLYGAGGTGKSWLGYMVCHATTAEGGIAVVVDYESNPRTVRERLKALGVAREQASRIAYWKVTTSLMPGAPARKVLDAFIERWKPRFILLDSVAKSMGSSGFNESDNADYIRWQQAVVEPWTYRRVTSLLIDHVGHVDPLGGKKAVAARGASAKKDQLSGASYYFEVKEPWTRTNDGHGTLTTAKDREGHRKAWAVAATVNVTVTGGGRDVAIELRAPQANAATAGKGKKVRRTWYMEQVSRYLEDCDPDKATATQVEKHFDEVLSKSKAYAAEALDTLVQESFVSRGEPQGGRRTVYLTVQRAYRAEEDSRAVLGDGSAAQPFRQGGLGGGGRAVVNFDRMPR